MTKHLVFSDLHFFRGRQYLVDTCRWIAGQIEQHRPENVVFCGDLNHTHNQVETDVLYDLAESVRVIADAAREVSGSELVAISGNHDASLKTTNKNLVHALGQLCMNVFAVTEPTQFGRDVYAPSPPTDSDGMKLYMQRFEAACQSARNAGGIDTLFGHLELADVRYSPASSHSSEHPFILPDDVKTIINGHYHHPETIESGGRKIIIVGSPCYMTYADLMVDEPRGILIYDSVSRKVTRIANPHGPIYHTIDVIQIPAVVAHKDVGRMRIRVKVDEEQVTSCKAAIMRLREVAQSVRLVGKTTTAAISVYKAETQTEIASVDPMAMINSYVSKKGLSDDVAEVGRNILRGLLT